MVSCSRTRKAECVAPCSWIRGRGCRKQSPPLQPIRSARRASPARRASCSRKRKADCTPPCHWVRGRGCKRQIRSQSRTRSRTRSRSQSRTVSGSDVRRNRQEEQFQRYYVGPPLSRNQFIQILGDDLSSGRIISLRGNEFPLHGHTYRNGEIISNVGRRPGPRVQRCVSVIQELQQAGVLSNAPIRIISRYIRTPSLPSECPICYEPAQTWAQCDNCKRSWCSACNQLIGRCPFCRRELQ